MGNFVSEVLETSGLKLKMIAQRITLLLAIFSLANSLPPSSDSKALAKGSGIKDSKDSKDSISSTCCSSTSPVTFETTGMGNFYQGERLGTYEPVGQSSDGRSMYKQRGGDNFLFYLAESRVWMMGPEPGRDFGGVLNRGSGNCPEELTSPWEYYVDWTDSWDEDTWMEVTCSGNNPNPTSPPGEPCTWGSYCDDCDIWAEANGVRYCCAVDCDHGSIDVSTSNGEVTCTCHH